MRQHMRMGCAPTLAHVQRSAHIYSRHSSGGTRRTHRDEMKSHASAPVRSRTAVNDAWSTSKIPEPVLLKKYIFEPYRYLQHSASHV